MKRRSSAVMMGIALMLVFMFAGMFSGAQKVYAEPIDGATTETLTPGQTFDFSTLTSGAHYVKITSEGEYTLKGTASNAMVIIDVPEGQTAKVYLDGVKLAPDSSAPGTENNRAAIQIMDSGGNVELISTKLTTSEFHGQGHMPAIRKDGKETKLTFDTVDHEHRGTIKAYADKDGYRTCAIGCYSPNVYGLSEAWANTCGNLFFEEGIIEAWGSQHTSSPYATVLGRRWQGGAAIGSNGYGSVHGITINGGYIYAHAGDNTAAAIGTSAAFSDDAVPFPTIGSYARDITINGGVINATHETEFLEDYGQITLGGAAIGSGWRSDVEGLTINGGTINIYTDNVDHTRIQGWYVGIGAGSEGSAKGVVINGGDIDIKARFTGIGGGFCGGSTDFSMEVPDISEPGKTTPLFSDAEWFGDCDVTVNGGNIKIDITEGTGIGGWKPDSKSGQVIINGGKIEIDSTGGKNGSCIGPGYHGRLRQINIHGGELDLKAKGDGSALGANIPYDRYEIKSFVNNISITGGTIDASGGAGMGGISKQSGYSTTPTAICIEGGNVKTELYSKCAPVNKAGDKLRLCRINLKFRPLAALQERIPVTSFDCTLEDGSSYDYLLGDVKTFVPESQLWFWLPEKAEYGGVKLSKPIDKDKTYDTFSGLLEKSDSGQYDFWPPVPLILHMKKGETSPADGRAKAGYLSTKATDFVPVNGESQGVFVKNGYYIEANGEAHIILDKNGNFVYPGDNGCNIYVNSKDQWIFEENLAAFRGVHLYADLEVLKYDLSFDSNLPDGASTELTFEEGKSWPADRNGLEAGKSVQLPGDSDFWLPGYSFDGWNTKADGSGKSFSAGEVSGLELRKTPDDPGKVKLYAQWSPRKYRVIFEPDDGEGSMEPQEMTFDKPATLKANGFSEEGNIFGGWEKAYLTGSRLYANKQLVTNICATPSKDGISDVTLRAVWRQTGTASVCVYRNDSPVSGLTVTAKGDGLSFSLSEDTGTPGCYVSGQVPEGSWQIEISGSEVPFDTTGKTLETDQGGSGTLILDYADVSISPDSTGIDPYISLSGGSQVKSLEAVPVGSDIHISSQITETGRVFDRYRTKKTTSQMDFHQADQDITILGQTDIFAYARDSYYFLHLDPNGGSGDALDMELSYKQEEALPQSPFTREGWTFKGWNTKADGSGIAYEDGQTVFALTEEDGATIWLFAQWEKNKPKPVPAKTAVISYDLNGGTLDGKTGIITEKHEVGEVITVMKAPKRKGYKFSYWKGSKYYPGDKYTVAEDHTLTAVWEKDKGGGGNGGNDPQTGDTGVMPWLVLMLCSLAALTGLCLKRLR